MNYRHAFPHIPLRQGGRSQTVENVAGFLMTYYPGKVANVMLNNVRLLPGSTDDQLVISALQDGKWDAAFATRDDTWPPTTWWRRGSTRARQKTAPECAAQGGNALRKIDTEGKCEMTACR